VRRASPTHDEQDEARHADEERNHLRGRKPDARGQTENVAARVVAEEFDDEAHDGVEHRVGEYDLPAKLLVPVQPEQEEKEDERGERFIKLRRMEMHAQGHARNLVRALGELDAPRQRRRLAPTATGGKAALSSDGAAQRNRGREGIGRLPPREFVASHQHVSGQHRGDEAAVEDAARTQEVEREEIQRMRAILRLDDEQQNLRPDNRRQQQPQAKIINALTRQPIAPGEARRHHQRQQKRRRQQHAVGVDGEIADAEKFWIHLVRLEV